MKPKKPRRKKCPPKCPCICHDGFGGAHPNQDCRNVEDDGFGANPKKHAVGLPATCTCGPIPLDVAWLDHGPGCPLFPATTVF